MTESAAPVAKRSVTSPLSPAQRRLWFLQQLEPGSPTYHISAAVRLRGAIRASALRHALDRTAHRHEVLRTALRRGGEGEMEQVVVSDAEIPLQEEDLSEADDATVTRRLEEFAARPFDLSAPPLLRAALFRTGPDRYLAAVAAHHCITDGWSMEILLRELGTGYAEAVGRDVAPLPELPLQYGDVAAWQQETGSESASLSYWERQLAGLQPLSLPLDRARSGDPTPDGADHHFVLPPDIVARLAALGRQQNATLFMVLLAAWQTLLARYGDQDDVAVGVPVAGRQRPDFSDLIGCFVNTVVLRTDVCRSGTFRHLLDRVRTVAMDGYRHQHTPFDRVVDALGAPRQPGRTPLVDVLFSFRPEPPVSEAFPDVSAELVNVSTGTSKFDLSLEIVAGEHNAMHARLQYSRQLFDLPTIENMAAHFARLLAGVVQDPDRPLHHLPLAGQKERTRLSHSAGRAAPPVRVGAPVHQRFAALAAEQPDAPAVTATDATLSRGDLNRKAECIAGRLEASSRFDPARPVGLLLGRNTMHVAGLLGVLKAGAAYAALDPAEPPGRLRRTLALAGITSVLTTTTLAPSLSGLDVEAVTVDDLWVPSEQHEPASAEKPPRPERETRPDRLAYVVLTSGSTGEPKCVAVEHRHLSNYLSGFEDVLAPAEGERHLVVSSLAADLCLTTLLMPLATGGVVDLVPTEVAVDPVAFAEHVRQAPADILKTAPSHLSALLAGPEAAEVLPRRTLVLAGEPLPAELVRRVRKLAPLLDIVNSYGPAETTVSVLYGRPAADADGLMPLTHRVGQSTAYVLDEAGEPVPVGVPGELCVGGPQVSRGYAGRPEETTRRFVPDPFADEPGARLYRTGDRARRRADGSVVLLGRIDRQIKVRGFRVEPGEVESALRAHPDVLDAAVLGTEAGLTAYVVTKGSPEVSGLSLREHLRSRLPEHLVPSSYVHLSSLPVTANGKLDERALRSLPVLPAGQGPAAASATRQEEAVADVWRAVLGVEEVGLDENFFDVGGHSLRLVELQQQFRLRLGREVAVLDLMRHTTVRSQARHLGEAGESVSAAEPGRDDVPDTLRGRDRAGRRRAARGTRRQPRRGTTW